MSDESKTDVESDVVAALQDVIDALAKLSNAQRVRVLDTVKAWYGLSPSGMPHYPPGVRGGK